MYFVGIDISKYKHDCFICNETYKVIKDKLTFTNTNEGFIQLFDLLKSLDHSKEIRIGFEATGHYHTNLMLFLEKNNYSFMEFNPALVKEFIKELDPPTLSIRGICPISCAGIISEFGDLSRFKSADACVSFSGLEPSISESGTQEHSGKMVKHGSGYLRYHLMNAAGYVFMHELIFTVYYYKNVLKEKNI